MIAVFSGHMLDRIRSTPYAGALLSGILIGVSFPPSGLGAIAWIGLVPLLIRLSDQMDWRSVVAESFVAVLVWVLIAGHWTLFHPILSARVAAAAGLLGLSISACVPFVCYGLARRASDPVRVGILIASAGIVEYAQFHTEIGFPWLVVGHTQATLVPINQLVAFFGVPGLTLWLLLINIGVATAAVASARKQRMRSVGFTAILLLGAIGLGLVQKTLSREVAATHVVLAVQPAIGPAAWSNIEDRSRPGHLMQLSDDAAASNYEIIIWPETTLPVLESRDRPSQEYLDLVRFVESKGVPLLTGAIVKDAAEGEISYYNSAVLLSPIVGITGRYDKRLPVPFAERVPYVDRLPWLQSLAVSAGGVEGYGIGERSNVLTYDDVHIGIMICFESVFGRLTDAAESEPIAYYVVLAQDGWWGETAGYRQHFAFTGLRAIETGRAVVQVTVTGITGVHLPDGSSRDETEWMERGARELKVPEYRGETLYSKLGDLPVLGIELLALLLGFVLRARKERYTATRDSERPIL